jgi:hypothetical protein
MTRVRYPAEFKAEAVPQVIERGDGAAQGTCLRRDACVLGRRRSRWPAPGTHLTVLGAWSSFKYLKSVLSLMPKARPSAFIFGLPMSSNMTESAGILFGIFWIM